jgi:hypothetical protein
MSGTAPTIEAANGETPKPPAVTLRDLAVRLTPNPALTVEGTLQMILSGIDNLPDEALARTLGHVGARLAGLDADPVSDEQWRAADVKLKLQLMQNARAMKIALREMAQ